MIFPLALAIVGIVGFVLAAKPLLRALAARIERGSPDVSSLQREIREVRQLAEGLEREVETLSDRVEFAERRLLPVGPSSRDASR